MQKISTTKEDETLIRQVINKGLGSSAEVNKLAVLRIALAISLNITTEPDPDLDRLTRDVDYSLEQVSWQGKTKETIPFPVSGNLTDYTDAYRALLSAYHDEDLFGDEDRFRLLLQRHIRRGMREIRSGWREGHDFFEYLTQELFAGRNVQVTSLHENQRPEIMRAISEIGVSGELQEKISGPRLDRYLVYLENVHDLDRIRRGLDKLSFLLGFKEFGILMENTDSPKVVALDIPRPADSWQRISSDQLRKAMAQPPEAFRIPVIPGVDVLGRPHFMDLSEQPHLLVAGTTGSGKSVCLHALVSALLWQRDVHLCLMDPKKVEFAHYRNLPNLFGGKVIDDLEEMFQALDLLVKEMDARIQQLSNDGARDLQELKQKTGVVIPRIVVFIEELADMVMRDADTEAALCTLAQKSRAAGIHLVLATQRPDAETFSGQLRSNIPGRIGLTVQKSSESKIILDETGAERLTGAGDMLLRESGKKIKRLHGFWVGRDDTAAAINHYRRSGA